MSLEYKSRNIDGVEFRVRLLPVDEGIDVLEKISSLFLPIFAAHKEMQEGITENFYSEVAAHLIARTRDIDVKNSIRSLLQETYVGSMKLSFDGKGSVDYNSYFSGKYALLFKVVGFALEINYPDFFSLASSAIQDLKIRLSQVEAEEVEAQEQLQVAEQLQAAVEILDEMSKES